MLHWGLGLVAVMIPVQLFFGHLTGLYVLKHQPAKFAAIEARWKTQQPASEVLIAIPDEKAERNLFAIEVPKLGSFIASGNWTSSEIGLETFPREDRPPVVIPVLRLSDHGGDGTDHARGVVVRELPALARPPGDDALVSLGHVPRVSDRLHRHPHRLVHRRGRAPAVGRVRAAAHQGRGHALAHHRRRAGLAGRLRARLRGVRLVRRVLHLQAAARGADRRRESHPGRHRQPAAGVRRQRRDRDRQQRRRTGG